MTEKLRILLVGVGTMGNALWSAWQESGCVSTITGISPHLLDRDLKEGEFVYSSPEQIAHDAEFDAVVFAVKPQKLAEVLPLYHHLISKDTTILSIAAGKSTDFLRDNLGLSIEAPIIRAMPNTPCQINEGVIGCYADSNVSELHRKRAEQLFSPTGMVFWVNDENKMHAVTAVSGSGPGFVDAFMEECEQNGMNHDDAIQQVLNAVNGQEDIRAAEFLRAYQHAAMAQDFADSDLTAIIACKVFEGTAKLALKENTKTFGQLREAVTSPNGTTAAGLGVWNAMKNKDLIERTQGTINAARMRSIELS